MAIKRLLGHKKRKNSPLTKGGIEGVRTALHTKHKENNPILKNIFISQKTRFTMVIILTFNYSDSKEAKR